MTLIQVILTNFLMRNHFNSQNGILNKKIDKYNINDKQNDINFIGYTYKNDKSRSFLKEAL